MIFQFLKCAEQFFSSSLCAGRTHWLESFPPDSFHAVPAPSLTHILSFCPLSIYLAFCENILSLWARTSFISETRSDWSLEESTGLSFLLTSSHNLQKSLEPTDLIKSCLTIFDKLQEINVILYFAHSSLPFSLCRCYFKWFQAGRVSVCSLWLYEQQCFTSQPSGFRRGRLATCQIAQRL